MTTGEGQEREPRTQLNGCYRAFRAGPYVVGCEREFGHGGSCSGTGMRVLDEQATLHYAISWHQETSKISQD